MSETEVTTEVQFEISEDLDTFATDFFGQKQSKEKPDETNPGVEQGDEAQASEDAEAQNDDAEQDDGEEAPQEEAEKPKKKSVQDRIDELVRQREEQKREADARIARLEQALEEVKKPAPVQVAQPQEPTPDAVDADGEPVYPLGEFDPQYIRDLTRFTLKQEEARVQAERAEAEKTAAVQAEHVALQTQWNEKLESATKDYPDLLEKGQTLLNGFTNLDEGYAGYLSTVIMSMDKGPDVLYYLANHPDEAATIVNSGAQKATLALGRIEARFLKDEQEAPRPKITKAPAPPTVRARGTNGAFVAVAPDTDNLEDFETAFFQKKK
jgi:hypothetical protein